MLDAVSNTSGCRTIAIFDLDRTLTRRGTWTPFLWSILRRRPARWPAALVLATAYLGCALGLIDRKRLKDVGLGVAAGGLDRARIAAFAGVFAERILACGLRPGAVATIDRHRRAGDRLVLATASLDLYAEPVAAALGIDTVVCTRSSWSAGKLRIAGGNCYGPVKLAALEAALAGKRGDRRIVAYSDDVSDLALLEWADHGVAVHPGRGLRGRAPARGIEIADWQSAQLMRGHDAR